MTCFLLAPTKGKDTSNRVPAIVLSLGVGYHAGLADLGKRFSSFSTLPAGVYFRSQKGLIVGFEYNRFLGNRFRFDSLYGGIVGPSQEILDQNGNPAVIRYYMRGFTAQGYVGKAFKVFPNAKYARLQVNFGAGFLQHRIKMSFDKNRLPQLEGDYAAGYDRLCNGFMMTQSVYYHRFNPQGLSFFAGMNFVQSFTQNQRNWDYSSMRHDDSRRKDFYLGFSAGILIPITLRPLPEKEYYD